MVDDLLIGWLIHVTVSGGHNSSSQEAGASMLQSPWLKCHRWWAPIPSVPGNRPPTNQQTNQLAKRCNLMLSWETNLTTLLSIQETRADAPNLLHSIDHLTPSEPVSIKKIRRQHIKKYVYEEPHIVIRLFIIKHELPSVDYDC